VPGPVHPFRDEEFGYANGEGMTSKNSTQPGDGATAGHEERFSLQVRAIIEKHEKQLLPHEPKREVFASDEAYTQHRDEYERELEKCQRELWLMRVHLLESRASIDYDNGDELKEMIATKLAVSSPNRIHASDWWWTPADPSFQDILRKIQRLLEKETASKARPWRQGISYAWYVLSELIYLAIVVGVFSVASSRFETVVFSALVMIYNAVSSRISGVGLATIYLMQRLEEAYSEIGRAVGLRVSVSPAREAAKQISKSGIAALIHNVSIGIGSLIALWHLLTVILS
jgi:hypothetical protein